MQDNLKSFSTRMKKSVWYHLQLQWKRENNSMSDKYRFWNDYQGVICGKDEKLRKSVLVWMAVAELVFKQHNLQ